MSDELLVQFALAAPDSPEAIAELLRLAGAKSIWTCPGGKEPPLNLVEAEAFVSDTRLSIVINVGAAVGVDVKSVGVASGV